MAARVNGDFDYLESISCDNIVVQLIGNKVIIPYCGVHEGKKAARHALEQVHVNVSFHNLNLDHIMIDGDQVGLRWSGVLRSRGTGASGFFQGFTHLIFENGLIKEYFALVDTATMNELAKGD